MSVRSRVGVGDMAGKCCKSVRNWYKVSLNNVKYLKTTLTRLNKDVILRFSLRWKVNEISYAPYIATAPFKVAIAGRHLLTRRPLVQQYCRTRINDTSLHVVLVMFEILF